MFAQNENSRSCEAHPVRAVPCLDQDPVSGFAEQRSKMNRSRRHRVACLGLLISMVSTISCGSGDSSDGSDDVPSADLGTADIEARVSIISPGDGRSEVAVDLDPTTPGVYGIELTGGERFEASHGAATRTLDRDSGLENPRYVTNFRQTSPMDAFALRFLRADASVVDLPLIALEPEFEVTSPSEDDSFTFADTISLEWAPAHPGSEMRLRLYSSCALIGGGTGSRIRFLDTEDDGSESFDLSTLSRADDPQIDQSRPCRLFIRFDREIRTSISPPFASGSTVVSTQRRRLENPLRF